MLDIATMLLRIERMCYSRRRIKDTLLENENMEDETPFWEVDSKGAFTRSSIHHPILAKLDTIKMKILILLLVFSEN